MLLNQGGHTILYQALVILLNLRTLKGGHGSELQP
jgi:hypothetical protein